MLALFAAHPAVQPAAHLSEPQHVLAAAARPDDEPRGRHGRQADYPRPPPAEYSGCWDEQLEGSFLQTGAAAEMKPQVDSDKWKQDYNWFANDKMNEAGKPPNRWADVPKLGLTGAESQPARGPPTPLCCARSRPEHAARRRAAQAVLPALATPPLRHPCPSHVRLPQIPSGRMRSRARAWTSRCGVRCWVRCPPSPERSSAARSSRAANAKVRSARLDGPMRLG